MRVRSKAQPERVEVQYGIMKGSGIENAIYIVRTLTERSMEAQIDLNSCFTDCSKVLDRVRYTEIMDILIKLNIDGKDVKLEFNKRQAFLGENVSLTLAASSASVCGVGIVSKSVNNLEGDHHIPPEKPTALGVFNAKSGDYRVEDVTVCSAKGTVNERWSCAKSMIFLSKKFGNKTVLDDSGLGRSPVIEVEIQQMVYERLTEEIVFQTRKHTNDAFIIDDAHRVKLIFDNLNNAFAQIHKSISHTKPIKVDSLPVLQSYIDTYMEQYRIHFSQKLIPKQHILEHHVIPHIKRFGFGAGLLGEQGTEASHQSISKITTRALGINDGLEKLKFIMSTHLLAVSPALRNTPKVKLRRQREKGATPI
ncbi:hypothetical protein PoB_005935200 [Plakobranchus ocellatus]|uniref:Uncharacterized protein n=1 Tax=Plakobranchus ocellatus TaxID=259542 RepID=A0AAV4CLR0_9GAST|nr:hypothetical protein PoB_005935200 [Plakobranchus ocellatus]